MIFPADFFPCIDYIRSLPDTVYINSAEQYRKQSYHTRAYILGPHRVEMLQVPVKKFSNHALISDIAVDYSSQWNRKAWKTLVNCYRNSPFFDYFEDVLYRLFTEKYESLLELNTASLTICLKLMQTNKTICLRDFSYYDYRNQFVSFNAKNRSENAANLPFRAYTQNFSSKFESNLSILDLLLMKGTGSWDIVAPQGIIMEKKIVTQ